MKSRLLLSSLGLFLLTGAASLWAQPIITNFSPQFGASGDKITLYGTGFVTYKPVTVWFWYGQAATMDTVTMDGQATVTVPSSAGSGPLAYKGFGSSVVQYTADNFTLIGPGPFITGFSPAYALTNDSITITGAHLSGKATVTFGSGTSKTVTNALAAGNQLTLNVPAGAQSGPISITISNRSYTSTNSFVVVGPNPYISAFSPNVGNPGTKVTIQGKLLVINQAGPTTPNVTNVTFNGKAGSISNNASDTQIEVIVPSGATSGPITASGPNGSYTTPTNLYFYLPPVTTGGSSLSGPAGTTVTITGTNFTGATHVLFNNLDASYSVLNNNKIQTTVPVGARSGVVQVVAPAGSAIFTTNFSVPPTIKDFTPTSGGTNTSVTLTGANFDDANLQVSFNGAPASSISGVSFDQLTAVVPDGATSGPITVSTVSGTSTTTNNFYLPPGISGFNPIFGGPGASVTISGRNFTNATLVTFNGTAATNFTVRDNQTISAQVPPGILTGPIGVTAPAQTAFSSTLFYGPPVITGFSPTHGLPGNTVTLSGTNFTDTTNITFNGTSAPFAFIDNFTLQAVVPTNAQTGPLSVFTPGGTSLTLSNFVLDYKSDLALTVDALPDPTMVGSSLVYTITVRNYGPMDAPHVRLTNTLPASVRLVSATIPKGATLTTNTAPVITADLGTMLGYNLAPVTVTLAVVPQTAGNITNIAQVGSDYPDPLPSNNSVTTSSYVQPLPVLSIRLIPPAQYQVSWPLGLNTPYYLAYKTDVAASGWTQIPASLWSTNNGQYVFTDSLTNAARFYQLRK